MKSILKYLRFVDSDSPRGVLRNLLLVNLVYAPLVSVLFVIAFGGFDHFGIRFLGSLVIAFFPGTFCILGEKLVAYLRARILTWLRRPIPPTTLLFGFASSMPFMLPGIHCGFVTSGALMKNFGPPWFRGDPDLTDYSVGVLTGSLVAGLFLLIEIIREQRVTERAAQAKFQDLENQRLQAEVAALSAQLNPHFLFNSLNTIAATIPDQPEEAEDMVIQLADLYRSILRAAKKQTHALEEELAICRSYLAIETMRFGQRLASTCDVDAGLNPADIIIPVLIVQPLVENAVKHGISPKKNGGQVSIRCYREGSSLMIEVSDNGLGSGSRSSGQPLGGPNSVAGENTGLKNCASRLAMLYGDRAELRFDLGPRSAKALLRIPLTEG